MRGERLKARGSDQTARSELLQRDEQQRMNACGMPDRDAAFVGPASAKARGVLALRLTRLVLHHEQRAAFAQHHYRLPPWFLGGLTAPALPNNEAFQYGFYGKHSLYPCPACLSAPLPGITSACRSWRWLWGWSGTLRRSRCRQELPCPPPPRGPCGSTPGKSLPFPWRRGFSPISRVQTRLKHRARLPSHPSCSLRVHPSLRRCVVCWRLPDCRRR